MTDVRTRLRAALADRFKAEPEVGAETPSPRPPT